MSEIVKKDENSGNISSFTETKVAKMPFKGIPDSPQRTSLILGLGVYLDAVLSLEGSKSVTRLEVLLPMISDYAWGLNAMQVKEAFDLYVRGKLPIEPRDNYLTPILFNKVINAYKSQKQPKPKKAPEMSQEEKDALISQGMQKVMDYFEEERLILEEYVLFLYDVLYDDHLLPRGKNDKLKIWEEAKIALAIEKSQIEETENRTAEEHERLKAIRKALESPKGNPILVRKSKELTLYEFLRKKIKHSSDWQGLKNKYNVK